MEVLTKERLVLQETAPLIFPALALPLNKENQVSLPAILLSRKFQKVEFDRLGGGGRGLILTREQLTTLKPNSSLSSPSPALNCHMVATDKIIMWLHTLGHGGGSLSWSLRNARARSDKRAVYRKAGQSEKMDVSPWQWGVPKLQRKQSRRALVNSQNCRTLVYSLSTERVISDDFTNRSYEESILGMA